MLSRCVLILKGAGLRIGYLGPYGTHSQIAAERFVASLCGEQVESHTWFPMTTLTHILAAVEEGTLDLGCVPVENSLEGSVAEVLDSLALKLNQTTIVAEFVRPIQHALIRRYEFLEGIEFIHSHPQAIGQCREAIYEQLGTAVKFLPASSTAEAVKALLTLDETHAALGSPQAARHYGLEVLIENLCETDQNATRFWVLSQPDQWVAQTLLKQFPAAPLKTSFCTMLYENRPGSLLQMLTILADQGLNMSKIESRPTKKLLGEYVFYVDIEGILPPEVEDRLRAETRFYKCLGIYPALGVLS